MTDGNVLGFLAAPDRQISLRAISLALLKVRAINGMTREKLGKILECSADTVSAASNEDTMLSFDCVARLCYFFPDESAPIHELWNRAVPKPTVTERLELIERELLAVRREVAA